MRLFILVLVVVALPACVSTDQEKVSVGGKTELDDFVEKLPGALVEIEMIAVPPGSISAATPDGVKTVEVEPFWISKTEVPWEIFDLYAFGAALPDEAKGEDVILRPSRPYGAPDRGYGHRGYAAISMTYLTANEFAQWLSAKTGKTYRIPTEAEWEYACHAGHGEEIPADELEDYAWYWDNAQDKTQPIGKLHGNEWELKDMLGNAAEWCTCLDGEPLACGGSFRSKAEEVGCSARMAPSPKWQETDPQIPKSRFWLTDGPFMGFRVVRAAEDGR